MSRIALLSWYSE